MQELLPRVANEVHRERIASELRAALDRDGQASGTEWCIEREEQVVEVPALGEFLRVKPGDGARNVLGDRTPGEEVGEGIRRRLGLEPPSSPTGLFGRGVRSRHRRESCVGCALRSPLPGSVSTEPAPRVKSA
jgi:hypothetical protein